MCDRIFQHRIHYRKQLIGKGNALIYGQDNDRNTLIIGQFTDSLRTADEVFGTLPGTRQQHHHPLNLTDRYHGVII
ncbi:hypothetical protein D9M68_927640 [compost metagenome]